MMDREAAALDAAGTDAETTRTALQERLAARCQRVARRVMDLYGEMHSAGEDTAALERLLPFAAACLGASTENGETHEIRRRQQIHTRDREGSALLARRLQPFANQITTRVLDLWDSAYLPDAEPADLIRILPILPQLTGQYHGSSLSHHLETRAASFARLSPRLRKATLGVAKRFWDGDSSEPGARTGGTANGAKAVVMAALRDSSHLIFAEALFAALLAADRSAEVDQVMASAIVTQLRGGTGSEPCSKELMEAADESLVVALKRLRENDPRRFAWVLAAIAVTHPRSPVRPANVQTALIAHIGDPSWLVGFTAAWALHRLGLADEVLRAVLPPKAGDPRQALHRLGRTGGGASEHPALWEAAFERVDDTDVRVRAAALEALRHLVRQQPYTPVQLKRAALCARTLVHEDKGLAAPLAAALVQACQEPGSLAEIDLFRLLREAVYGEVAHRPVPQFAALHEKMLAQDTVLVAVRLITDGGLGATALAVPQAFDALRRAAPGGRLPDRVVFEKGFALLFPEADWEALLSFLLRAAKALAGIPCVLVVHTGKCRLEKGREGAWRVSEEVEQAMARTDFGREGQVLLTGAVEKQVRTDQYWRSYVRDLSVRRVAGREAHIFDLYGENEIGVLEKPGLLVTDEPQSPAWKAAAVRWVLLACLLILLGGVLSSKRFKAAYRSLVPPTLSTGTPIHSPERRP